MALSKSRINEIGILILIDNNMKESPNGIVDVAKTKKATHEAANRIGLSKEETSEFTGAFLSYLIKHQLNRIKQLAADSK